MLWIEDIVESTSAPPFLTNSRIDIGFVDLHKVVARRNASLALPNEWNGCESKGGAKVEGWSVNFHMRKGIWI